MKFIIEDSVSTHQGVSLYTDISIGYSQAPDLKKAAAQASAQVKSQLSNTETDLVLAFASPEYASADVLAVINRDLRPKRLIGTSTGRIILSSGVTNRGIALMGINSNEIEFGVSAINDIEKLDMHYIGYDLSRRASQNLNAYQRELFISFAHGIEKKNSTFIRGIKESLGGMFPVLGAVCSDDFKYQDISQFFQDQVLHRAAVGLILGGSFHLALGCKHGFKPLGKPRFITKCDGNIINTIDHKPAIDIYKHFLGKEAEELKAGNNSAFHSPAMLYPLGIYLEDSRQYLLRNLIDILKDGSIVCHEGLPQGAEVHLMISNIDSCINSAVEAAKLAKASLADRKPKLVLIFESMARHKLLGNAALTEVQAIKQVLGPNVPMIGMCSYGELGPFGTLNNIKDIYLHNESILILALS